MNNLEIFPRKKIKIKDRYKIYMSENFCCKICGSKKNLTIDHIVPISKGGKNEISNYQALCQQCNSKKKVDGVGYVEYQKTISNKCTVMPKEIELEIEKIGAEILGIDFKKDNVVQKINQKKLLNFVLKECDIIFKKAKEGWE